MKRTELKQGFTLVELMVFFLFISILLAASTPLITKRIRNTPQRTYHGKFLCYRDGDGNLLGEYYNGAGKVIRKVTSEDNETIVFEPPKRASIYKIEMVGAGAGGYNYVGYKNEANPMHKSYFNKDGEASFSGETTYNPNDDDIISQMHGVLNTISAYTGKGGNAGKIYYTYSVPSLTLTRRANAWVWKNNKQHYLYYDVENFSSLSMSREWSEAGEDYINTKSVIQGRDKEFKDYILAKYPNTASTTPVKTSEGYTKTLEYTATPAVQNAMQTKAQELLLDSIYNIPISATKSVNGATGGKPAYISYTYQIDFNSNEAKNKSAQDYIKYLMRTYQSGKSYYPANSSAFYFYPNSRVSDGADGKSITAAISKVIEDFKNSAGLEEEQAAKSGDGQDAQGYAALRIGDNLYLTNAQKATGGKDTRMLVEAEGRIKLEYTNGKDANSAGMIDSEGNIYDGDSAGIEWNTENESSYKYLELVSTVPYRTYLIGARGENGTLVTKEVANLGKQCTISIPPLSQSAAFDSVSTLTTADTVLTCQDWKNPIIASSAYPKANCQTTDDNTASCNSNTAAFPMYNPYKNFNDNNPFTSDGFVRLPEYKEILAQIAKSPQFGAISKVLTKGPDIAQYGMGGNGAYYKDKCMKIGGNISINTVDSKSGNVSKTRVIDFPYDASCRMTDNEWKPATDGTTGAVIISW